MVRIKAVLEYQGTNYHGFQRQPGAVTVESTLLKAIQGITGEATRLLAASRTDAGVHARGQVITFDTGSSIPAKSFTPALNSILPADIRVLSSEEVEGRFHPRYDAQGKQYQYLIYRQEKGRTFYRDLAYYYPYPLDGKAMKQAAKRLEGTHDFRAFCASRSGVKNFVRTVSKCELVEKPPFLLIEVWGDGFLYNMVRIMVGTLLSVGRKRISPHQIDEILLSRCRSMAGSTAPPSGLYLVKVFY